jgi:RNA polymerase sigma-70 factor (sigma-E family)
MTAPPFDDRFAELSTLAYRVAFRILGDRGDAQDVAQEALARAYARWGRVHGHADPWVARVSANLAIGRWRRRGRSTPAAVPPGCDSAQVAADRVALATALAGLPRRQREVVVLRFLADRSEAAVAEELGCSVGTVKQHTHRALAALRRALGAGELEVDGVGAP